MNVLCLLLWRNLLENLFSNVFYCYIGCTTIHIGYHAPFFHVFVFFYIRKKNNLSLSIFCQKLPFLPQNAWFFFLKSKNGVLEIFLKSNILCTKILGTVKFFLKSKNFLKSNVLKSKIHCISDLHPKVNFIHRQCMKLPRTKLHPNITISKHLLRRDLF